MTAISRPAEPCDAPQHGVRPLSPSEAVFAFSPGVFVGYSTLCRGSLNLAALDKAFVELQQSFATLRGAVEIFDSVPWFISERQPASGVRIFEGEDLNLQPTGRAATFDQADRLAYLDVIIGDEFSRVTLFIHHSIADGHHALALLEELWHQYTRYVETGRFLSRQPCAFAQSGENLLGRSKYPEAPSETDDSESLVDQLIPLLAQHETFPLELTGRLRLNKEETRVLIDRARKENLTVNTLVSAAIIRASGVVGEVPLLYMYYVDLRNRVSPPIEFTEVTNMLSNAYFPVDSVEDLVTLAHRIKLWFASDLDAGVLHRDFMGTNAPALFQDTSGHLVISTNWGIVPRLRCPRDVSIVDFQSFFSVSPLVPAFAKLTGKTLTGYAIHTFDEQLSIEFMSGELIGDDQLLVNIHRDLLSMLGCRTA